MRDEMIKIRFLHSIPTRVRIFEPHELLQLGRKNEDAKDTTSISEASRNQNDEERKTGDFSRNSDK
jgi:hypothetical protein